MPKIADIGYKPASNKSTRAHVSDAHNAFDSRRQIGFHAPGPVFSFCSSLLPLLEVLAVAPLYVVPSCVWWASHVVQASQLVLAGQAVQARWGLGEVSFGKTNMNYGIHVEHATCMAWYDMVAPHPNAIMQARPPTPRVNVAR